MLASAIAFARRGNPVLPLTWPMLVNGRRRCSCHKAGDCSRPAKHPLGRLVPEGLLNATTDETTIRKWFVEEPPANLGVRTDLLVVLDADLKHGGDETLAELERANPFPPTWRVCTGGGGRHVLFERPADIAIYSSNADTDPVLGPGVDVRALNGYVVAVPSRHISGREYCWSVDHHPADIPLAEAPAWLVERLAARAVKQRQDAAPSETWQRLTAPVREYPDAAATQVAGHLLRRWVDPHLVAGLLHAWNRTYVDPPLEDAELRRILDRVARLEDKRRDALEDPHARTRE